MIRRMVMASTLANLSLPQATITAAQEVSGNGRYCGEGGGGHAGQISYAGLAEGTTAKWTGEGRTDDAANFICVDGRQRSADFRVAETPS